MKQQEMQHWLGSNRPPRVQITYDVETLGAPVKQEIPFIVGILGDFAGSPQTSTIAERSFVELDRDNFGDVMQSLAPSVKLATAQQPFKVVRNPDSTTVVQDTSAAGVTPKLSFTCMDHFAPPSVIKQLDTLAALMATRQNLSDLLARLGTDPSLEGTLTATARPLVVAGAKTALNTANAALTTATTGALALFDTAVTDVLAVETTGDNHDRVTAAQAKVTAAVGAGTTPTAYTKAIAAGTAAAATTADVQLAGAAAWSVATAMRDGMTLLATIADGYEMPNPADPANPKQKAKTDVQAAQAAVDTFVAAAGQAAVSGLSSLALNPSQPTPAK